MPDQIFIGNFGKGLKTDRIPPFIDQDSFPNLFNFYAWRGQARRKRGTSYLGQLARQVQFAAVPLNWQFSSLTLTAAGIGRLFGAIGIAPLSFLITNITQAAQAVVTYTAVAGVAFEDGQYVNISLVIGMTEINGGYYRIVSQLANTMTLDVDSILFTPYGGGGVVYVADMPSVKPGTINLVAGGFTYTEPAILDGTLLRNGLADPGSLINYATGEIILIGNAGPAIGTFSYYPGLPVMGIEDFTSSVTSANFPLTIAFDTEKAYQINQSVSPPAFYNVTYYKGTNSPFSWSGQDFQQFWTTNYPSTTTNFSGAFWATNNKPGFNFANATAGAIVGNSVAINLLSNGSPVTNLIVGDQLWFNEWVDPNVNGVIGLVSDNTLAATGDYTVTFTVVPVIAGTGIVQLLTASIAGQDGIKWYDGDPTSGTGLPTATGLGWVNFAPPLTALTVQIDSTPSDLYYLVGALAIVPFKDRLLFFSPYIQSSTSLVIQLQDTCLWSWNGTPFYNALVPLNQTYDVTAYYVDQTGKGGYLPAGISNPIKTVNSNEDVLMVGFGGSGRKTRFVYTGNDLQPFLFFNVNNALPSTSTFSAVSLDRGVIDIGQYGIAMTDQQSSQRVDTDIPDSVFQVQTLNSGFERVSGIRDFFREWIYFSYPVNNSDWKFPTQTFLFNYRDNTWAIFYENFTTHGNYRAQNKRTWLTLPFKTWRQWREPWNSGAASALFVTIAAGNPQGYVLLKDQGTNEAISGTISAISSDPAGLTRITSINHCVTDNNTYTKQGDYLLFSNITGMTSLNGVIGRVAYTEGADNFVVDIPFPTGTYLGLGNFTRLSQPLLQTKQFPVYWQEGRQVRLGVQRYLLSATANSQMTVNIYLSQDPDEPFNNSAFNVPPNGLIYSQLLYTCPESTNLGLTPANVNLQMPIGDGQYQIWHRINTSLIGDTFQLGLTLSEAQMKNLEYATAEITCHAIQVDVSRSSLLA